MPKKKAVAADITKFAITATLKDRRTKTKKYQMGEGARDGASVLV